MDLWDTNGHSFSMEMTKFFIKNSKIVVFVYDITDRIGFQELTDWIEIAREILGIYIICGIMGNKSDLFEKQEISNEEAETFAKSNGMKIRFVSTLENALGIKEFMAELLDDYLKTKIKKYKIEKIFKYYNY